MWSDILEKIQRVKSLDKNFVLFGAEYHHYQFNSPVSKTELDRFEAQLRVALPFELQQIYLQLGNGGVGPDYGLYTIDQLQSFQADKPWPGVKAVEAECTLESLAGVVAIMDRYPNYTSYLICSGDSCGSVFAMEEEQFAFLESESLYSLYLQWVDQNLLVLNKYVAALRSTTDVSEIIGALSEHPENSLVICASLLGVENFTHKVARDALAWDAKTSPTRGFTIRENVRQLFAKLIVAKSSSL